METGLKYDGDKLRWDLIPLDAVEQVVRVLTFGAKKYAPNNWQIVDSAKDRYYAALLRHIKAWRCGESIDPDSGLFHLAHVACNAIFLLWFELKDSVQSSPPSLK